MERRRTAAADRSATQMSELQYSLHSARDGLRTEPRAIRIAIIAVAVIFLTIFVVLPLVVVFAQAFSKGIGAYFAALSDSEALSAIRLTLLVAAISVSLNLVFGVIAAWAIAKFEFSGRTALVTLIDLPFSVSPVISGLVFVLLFGAQGYWGPWLQSHDIHVLFAIRLTLLVAAISVSLNLVFGVIAAWAIAKFEFSGRTALVTLIDLPFSVSPVISGLVFVLLFGAQGYWGPWLQSHDIHVLFA